MDLLEQDSSSSLTTGTRGDGWVLSFQLKMQNYFVKLLNWCELVKCTHFIFRY
jgi:hypothetical protein